MANDIAQRITALTELAKAIPESLLAAVDDPNSPGKKTKKLGFGTFLKTYNRSAAEISLGLSNDDLDFKNDSGIVNRYGENTTPGTTDMTNAGQIAFDLRKRVKFLEETYLISTLDYGTPSFANQMDIIGSGKNNTVLKASGAGPILKLGSPSMTNFIAGIAIRGITFEGDDSTTTEGIVSRGLVRSVIDDCKFEKCTTGLYDFGGLTNLYNNCHFDGNGIGLRFDFFSGAFYTGDPNNNTVSNCKPINNTDWGIHFDFGRLLNVIACDFEGNGNTALGADFGGMFVGANAGARITNYETALLLSGCWFEANIGFADIWLNGGFNVIENSYMRTSAAGNVYDIFIERGNYQLKGVFSAVTKTPNVAEAVSADVQAGNSIIGCEFANITVDESKTIVLATPGAVTPQTLTGAGAVNITSAVTFIVTTGTDALTLVDGTENQRKSIVMKTDGGVGTLTPTNLANGTTLTFDDVGDSADLLFINSAWYFMGGTATLA